MQAIKVTEHNTYSIVELHDYQFVIDANGWVNITLLCKQSPADELAKTYDDWKRSQDASEVIPLMTLWHFGSYEKHIDINDPIVDGIYVPDTMASVIAIWSSMTYSVTFFDMMCQFNKLMGRKQPAMAT